MQSLLSFVRGALLLASISAIVRGTVVDPVETSMDEYQQAVEEIRQYSDQLRIAMDESAAEAWAEFPRLSFEQQKATIQKLQLAERVYEEEVVPDEQADIERAHDRMWRSIFEQGSETPDPEPDVVEASYQPAYNGHFPVADADPSLPGELTFHLYDVGTRLPLPLTGVHRVDYEANFDPAQPELFEPIGSSTDPASAFSVPFTVRGFEPMIVAFAYGADGALLPRPGTGELRAPFGVLVVFGPTPDIPIPSLPDSGTRLAWLVALGSLAASRSLLRLPLSGHR